MKLPRAQASQAKSDRRLWGGDCTIPSGSLSLSSYISLRHSAQIEMALQITDDHTTESVAEVMSQLQFDQGTKIGPEARQQLLRDLDFQRERQDQDEEEYSQFVFQGQCLILGDSRVGKTSLVKSLTGKPFDSEEPSTKGVQTSWVDRKWQNLNADTDLKFGSFGRFYKSVRFVIAMLESGGCSILCDYETISILSPASKILSLCWIISVICLGVFVNPPVGFYIFSFLALVTAVVLPCVLRVFHVISVCQEVLYELSILRFSPGLMKGLVGLMLLSVYAEVGKEEGIECSYVEFSFSIRGLLKVFAWCFHLSVLSTVFLCTLIDLTNPPDRKYSSATMESVDGSSLVHVRERESDFTFLHVVAFVYAYMFSKAMEFLTGSSRSALLTYTSVHEYCQFLHITVIVFSGLLMFFLIRTLCRVTNIMKGIASPILFIFVVESIPNCFTSFYSMKSYRLMLGIGFVCHIMILACISNYFVKLIDYKSVFIHVRRVALDYQKLRGALDAKFSNLKLGILDFAGDKEYYVYHHLFLRNQAIYVVVFNMAHFAADNFKTVTGEIQRLHFWLESICSQVAPKTPIFLVGTHRGNMNKSCIDCLQKHLKQSLWHNFSDELVVNEEDKLIYFPVENKQGANDSGIQNLKRKIVSTAQERKTTIGCKIPFSWIKIQDAIINLRQNNKKANFCVTLEQFPTSFKNFFICSNWSKETLNYFNEKGLIIYVDRGQDSEMSKWVLLKPSILVDVIIQLVTPPASDEMISEHGFRRDWTLLLNTGMLTESLLRNILSKLQENEEAMKGFLEEYDIICPLFYKVTNEKEEAKVTHFVPSLLPMSVNGNTPVWHNEPTDKRLFVFFKRFLPEGLFHHLLSRAHRLSMANFPSGQPVIYRNVGRFWFSPAQPYRLLVLKKENMIEVTFSCRLVLKDTCISDYYKMQCSFS